MKYIILLLTILILYNPILAYLIDESIKYIDDILLILCPIILLTNLKYYNSNKSLKFFFLFSLISLLFSPFKIDPSRYLFGTLYILKVPLFFYTGFVIGKRFKIKSSFIENLIKYNIYVFVIILIINFLFLNYWVNITGTQQIFEGNIRILGPFTNAGRTSWFLAISFAYLISNKKYLSSIITLPFLYITYIKKSVLSVLTIILLRIKKLNYGNKIFIAPILILFFIILWEPIFMRFIDEYKVDKLNIESARIALFLGSYEIINDFPYTLLIGISPGLYGGIVSGVFYSPVYYYLNYNNLYGFNIDSPSYLADNYFSHILTEIGLVGIILLFFVFVNLYNQITDSNKSRKLNTFFKYILIVFIIETLGISAPEMSQVVFFTFFIPGIYIGINYGKLNKC